MIDRDYVLNLIRSKDVSIQEFNYNKLIAPPIHYYFNDIDLNRLYQIATSLRYSGKPQTKYEEIDKIMKSRGFEKFGAGTNRVIYKCLENDTFVVKIATNNQSITDNPREFINQEYLKPFCAKTFEVSRNGVLAFSERVNPITCIEEFMSVAEDIFDLIHDFIIGEYVMDDIGSKYFMNYGLRQGFGPVVLDYVGLYKLDGNKLFCWKQDKHSETGVCGGEIDYDAGYNILKCKRCGKDYFAHDLELKVKNNEIITNKGEHKMKVTISGGTKGYNVTTSVETKNVEENTEQAVWTGDNKSKEIHVSLKEAMNKNKPVITREVKSSNNKVAPQVKKAEEIVESSVNGVHPEETKEEAPVVEEKPTLRPIVMAKDPNEEKTPVEILRDTIYDAATKVSSAELTNKIDIEYVSNAVKYVKYLIDTLRGTRSWNANLESDLFNSVVDNEHLIIETLAEVDGKNVTAKTIVGYKSGEYIGKIFSQIDESVIDEVVEDVEVAEAEKENPVRPASEIEVQGEEDYEYEPSNESDEDYEEYYYDDDVKLTGIATFTGKIIDISTKFPDLESNKVLVIEDAAGELLTVGENGDKLLVVDRINEMDTSDAEIVSKEFLKNVMKDLDNNVKEVESKDQLPTVNGVPNEE